MQYLNLLDTLKRTKLAEQEEARRAVEGPEGGRLKDPGFWEYMMWKQQGNPLAGELAAYKTMTDPLFRGTKGVGELGKQGTLQDMKKAITPQEIVPFMERNKGVINEAQARDHIAKQKYIQSFAATRQMSPQDLVVIDNSNKFPAGVYKIARDANGNPIGYDDQPLELIY